MPCEPFKISKISRIVFASSDRPYRASYIIVLPSGNYIVSHNFVDKIDVDQSALEINPYSLKKAQIFVYLVCGQGLFLCADPLKILVFRKTLSGIARMLELGSVAAHAYLQDDAPIIARAERPLLLRPHQQDRSG